MPQHLTPAWQKELGEDYEQIHEQWLHRVANLTLTAYNSKYSNSSFSEKKTMKNGFKDSGIRLNSWIAEKDRWTLAELEERSEYLSARALTIWPMPASEYKPKEKQLDTYTLEDEGELTGRQIAKFAFNNTEQPVLSWVEMFQKVIQILYAEDKSIITKLAMSEEDNIALHFSTNPGAFTKSVEIGNGIYVWTNTSTQSKLSVLNRLFKLYDENPADLVFYLRDDNENSARLLNIAEILRLWTVERLGVNENLAKCNCTYTRFTTDGMSEILPDIPNAPSGWNTDNHYFYEIVNRTGKSVYIQFALSAENATKEFLTICDLINEVYPAKASKEVWKWRTPFKTSIIDLNETLSKDEVFAQLDNCFTEIQLFEADLKQKLNA